MLILLAHFPVAVAGCQEFGHHIEKVMVSISSVVLTLIIMSTATLMCLALYRFMKIFSRINIKDNLNRYLISF